MSRASRLQHRRESGRRFVIRRPRVDRGAEIKAAVIYAGIGGLAALALAVIDLSGDSPGTDTRAMLAFGLGLMAACALSSCLTPLIALRHRLLLVSLCGALVSAGGILLGITWIESLAKIIFATSTGLWLALMLTSISQVLIVAALIIFVDFYSVFLGPTRRIVESGSRWIDYLTINLPVFGEAAVSRLGVSDIIFFSLFVGCALSFRLRRTASALAMTFSFVATMIVGVQLDIGVPALPLLSIFFILANADLLYRRFLEEPGTGGGAESS